MNIVTPFAISPIINTANPNTEAVRRDNILRETIPQPTRGEGGTAEQGLGSEGDRARQSAGLISNPTYERPEIQATPLEQGEETGANQQDNGQDQSAGREDAQQEQREQAEIRELQTRDREVRAHEQAHAAVGGQYAGTPTYEFETGPDGQRYAVAGEVSIDISEAGTPEETVRKLQQVRAAALAPAEPSAQDLRVAAEAARGVIEAQAEIVREANEEEATPEDTQDASTIATPSLDDIVNQGDVTTPTRSLDSITLEEDDETDQASLTNINRVISQFYERAVTPQDRIVFERA